MSQPNKAPFQLLRHHCHSHVKICPQRPWQYLRERVTLSFSQTKSLGVVLPLVVRLCDGGGAEGGVAQLAVVILGSQDHPAPWLTGAHLPAKTRKEEELHLPSPPRPFRAPECRPRVGPQTLKVNPGKERLGDPMSHFGLQLPVNQNTN